MGLVFFSRCKPEQYSAIKIAVAAKQLFIGWPAVVAEPQAGHLRASVLDIADKDWELKAESIKDQKAKSQYKKNCRFASSIQSGDIGLIPSAQEGIIYAGRVQTEFGLHDDPPWSQSYLEHIQEQGADISQPGWRLIQVAQSCGVDFFRPLPYSSIPAWIRRSLFGQATYGVIKGNPDDDFFDPFTFLDHFIEHPFLPDPAFTLNSAEAARRLMCAIGPNSFEHLCVHLLQLEHPDQRWSHVGGSGDGGVDGIGTDKEGMISGLLQCKYACSSSDLKSAFDIRSDVRRKVFATLSNPDLKRDGIEVWNRSVIAKLVLKHSQYLPVALTMRIGSSYSNGV